MTSPARGGRIIPIKHYVEQIAKSSGHYDYFKNKDGADPSIFPYYQQGIWNSEGGSIYNITPEIHMQKISQMGVSCFEEAEKAMAAVKENQVEAHQVYNIMKGYMLLTKYYEFKVLAAISAMTYAKLTREQDKEEAQEFADAALESYLEFADFAHEELDPYYIQLSGAPLNEAGVPFMELVKLEKKERADLAIIFNW